MWAIDLGIASGVGLVAGSNVLAPVDSTVVSSCDAGNNHRAIKLEATDGTLYSLIHVTTASVKNSYKQGDVIGTVAADTPWNDCAKSQKPHLHFGLPSQNFTIDGYTFNTNSPAYLSTLTSTNGNSTPPDNGGGIAGFYPLPVRNNQIIWNENNNFSIFSDMSPTPLEEGDQVIAIINGLNVRNSPAGSSLGRISTGSVGTYKGQSSMASLNGQIYNWLNIDWENGISGFSAEEYINYKYNSYRISFLSRPRTIGLPENIDVPVKPVPVSPSLLGILSASIIGIFLKLKRKVY